MKKNIGLASVIFGLLLIIVFFDRLVGFIINVQWFREVGYLDVYFTRLLAALKLMVPIFIVFWFSIWFYYRSIRKSIRKVNKVIEIDSRGKKVESRIFHIFNLVISFLLSYFIAFNYWYRILLFGTSTDFNVKDPIFNNDISFYVFKLPLLQSLYGTIIALLVLLIIITIAIYAVVGARNSISSIDISNPFSNIKMMKNGLTAFAGKQLAVLSALIMLMVSGGYILKCYYLLYSPRGIVYGASYTDIKVSLNFYRVIAAVAFIAAIVVFASILMSKVKPIIISIVALIALVILEGVTSLVVQNLFVNTNQVSFEEPYISHNIEYTRKAFNLDVIKDNNYDIGNTLTKNDLTNNKDIVDNIKVNSFQPALSFYNQVQVMRYYYGFNDIDIDRYKIDNKETQVFVSPREINSESIEPNTWQNRHLIYTHGYGLVMSKVNSVTPEGQPNFVMKNIPTENSTNIKLDNQRIYFGEKTDYYAVVNTNENEVDYPSGSSNATYKYQGKSGIEMNWLNRLLFAINERNSKFIISQSINSDSKILINRNVMDRAKMIAPFLLYDKDPYIVAAEGRLFWVIDAYTVSDRYPYAQPYGDINYMRNSVKVVVDAFDGTTNFYIVDKNDPIIMSYSKIFKNLFKDIDSVPAEIRDHFRYPEDLFKVQSEVLGKYHITDPRVFLTGEDQWQVAQTSKKVEGEKQQNEAFYVFMKLPQETKEEMVLLEYFNIRDKENMSAMLGARMDGDNYGKMVLYKFPTKQTIYSPNLFNKKFNQDPVISKELSLWEGKGSTVYYGDTVIVPIKDSLLYVEPVYLIAEGKNAIPEMKKVIVGYGEKIVLADSIDKALEQLFNYSDSNNNNSNNTGTSNTTVDKGILGDLIKQSKDLYDKALEAQKNLDWAKYGEYINKLGEVLSQLNK